MARTPIDIGVRLMAKTIKLNNGCWLWCGTINGAGYGTIGLGSKVQGKGFVHRVSYELHHGPIPEGNFVCHKCDRKRCINPDHLFAGTQSENLQDMISKGRACSGEKWNRRHKPDSRVKGEQHGRSKLTEAQVLEAVELFKCGMNKTHIGNHLGVCRATIRNIVTGKNWRHLCK